MTKLYANHLARQGFNIERKIASGLSGKTMLGTQGSLNRPVAIKFFDSVLSANDLDLRKRFQRESILLAELQHPSIPYVITHGVVPGSETPYIVMQYISGITLEAYIKNNSPVTPEVALHISIQILDALKFVHSKNIIHRDIKPLNIMILPSGHCYLIDFSIGFKIDPGEGMTRVTRTGDGLGSVQYISPEQSKNMKAVDQRADIYSFAIVLCELLTGKPDVSSLNDVKLPALLKKVIRKAASYSINERYNQVSDFLRELKQVSLSSLPLLDTPSKAACLNVKCPEALWSEHGYYKGANFIDQSTNAHCTNCGDNLIYQCKNCGASIDDTKFCGGCGFQHHNIPECGKCGSYLKIEDMGKDTATLGCVKCNKKESELVLRPAPYAYPQPLQQYKKSIPDDVPF